MGRTLKEKMVAVFWKDDLSLGILWACGWMWIHSLFILRELDQLLHFYPMRSNGNKKWFLEQTKLFKTFLSGTVWEAQDRLQKLHDMKSLGSLGWSIYHFCGYCGVKQTSASSETECIVSHCNTPPPLPLCPPSSSSHPALCDGATAPTPAVPAAPNTWTRWAAPPAAFLRNCLGLRKNKTVSRLQ